MRWDDGSQKAPQATPHNLDVFGAVLAPLISGNKQFVPTIDSIPRRAPDWSQPGTSVSATSSTLRQRLRTGDARFGGAHRGNQGWIAAVQVWFGRAGVRHRETGAVYHTAAATQYLSTTKTELPSSKLTRVGAELLRSAQHSGEESVNDLVFEPGARIAVASWRGQRPAALPLGVHLAFKPAEILCKTPTIEDGKGTRWYIYSS